MELYGCDGRGIEERKVKIARLADKDGSFELTKRSNIANATNRLKIFRHVGTDNELFTTDGYEVYEEFREDFFEKCEAEFILLDLLFNYWLLKGSGLMKRGRFGPLTFKGVPGPKALENFPMNPYALTIRECEKEALQILKAMFKGRNCPIGIAYQIACATQAPILNVFAEFDPIFFSTDSEQIAIAREAYKEVTFTDKADPMTTKTKLDKLKNVWNIARGTPLKASEEIPLLLEAIYRGNMKPHYRSTHNADPCSPPYNAALTVHIMFY